MRTRQLETLPQAAITKPYDVQIPSPDRLAEALIVGHALNPGTAELVAFLADWADPLREPSSVDVAQSLGDRCLGRQTEDRMDRWIVVLEDCRKAGSAQIRRERFEEHFAFLRKNFYRIVFSCGLLNCAEGSESSYGGFWIVEAKSKEDVVELYKEDPYFQLGLREKIDVFRAHEGYM